MRKLVAIAAAVALMVGAVAPAAYAGGSTGTNVALGLASFAVFNQLVGPLFHPRPYVREVVVERPVYVAPAPVVVIPERATYATVIQYPNGRYELHGDGIYTAYQWIWIPNPAPLPRSEEHTSELQSHSDLVCRLLLEKKKNHRINNN